MLKNIPPILGPELLQVLRAMGHGDELVIADANFPASSVGPRVLRVDGVDAIQLADAVLTLMPLDEFVPEQAFVMQVVGDPTARPPIFAEFEKVIAEHDDKAKLGTIERFAFYERAAKGFA